MVLLALYWWAHRLQGPAGDQGSENDPIRTLSIVADGSEQPSNPVPVAFQSEACVPWAISRIHRPPPGHLFYLVINSKMVDPAGLVLSGFAEECGQNLRVLVHEDLKEGQLEKEIAANNPAAVIAVGMGAVSRVQKEAVDVPVLFSQVADPLALGLGRGREVGVSPWVPAEPMIRHLLRVLPKRKSLAIIYPTGSLAEVARQAAQCATKLGREVILLELSDRNQVEELLLKAVSKAEAWIVFPDRLLIDNEVFNRILVEAEKRAIPVGVSNEEHVRRGALVGVGPDSFRIGRQLCRLAGAVYRSELPITGRIFCPEYSFAVINNAVIEKLGYTLELQHIRQAKLYKWH